MIKEMTKSNSEIVLMAYEQAYGAGFEDMGRRLPDISKIQRLIGYKPSLDLPEMLQRIIAHEQQLQGKRSPTDILNQPYNAT
jgi:UDP-glucose 4-epimerase